MAVTDYVVVVIRDCSDKFNRFLCESVEMALKYAAAECNQGVKSITIYPNGKE